MSATVTKAKKGFVVEYTNTYLGMLEQGGVAGRKVLVPYGALPGLAQDVDLASPWNDLYTVEELLAQVAMGRLGNVPCRVLRKGRRIQ